MRLFAPCGGRRIALLLAAALAAIGCGGAADPWIGSVDAVFRYRPSDQSTVVYEIRPGSMAERAGLKPGDRVLALDGVDLAAAPYEQVRAALRGPVGTTAKIAVQRDGIVIEIDVERKPVREDAAAGPGA